MALEQENLREDLELSIVMPCLNEAETLASCIEAAKGAIDSNALSAEIVIGDNGSTDGSQAIAESLGARVVEVEPKGYGSALYYATQAARGKYVIMGDSDGSYDFSNIMPLLEQLRADHDLVMGNRFAGAETAGVAPDL